MATDIAMVLNNLVKITNAYQIGCMIEIYVANGQSLCEFRGTSA